MTRAPELALALVGVLLATLVAAEAIRPSDVTPTDDATGIVVVPRLRLTADTSHRSAAEKLSAAAVDMQHVDAWAAEILARPLFAHNRRPPDQAVATQAATVALPRLTGVAVSPIGRSAIFAGGEGGKPVVVSLGGKIGRYTVSAIEPGAVTVNGPDGARTLTPSFDAARQAALATSAQVASQIAAAQAAAVAAASQAAQARGSIGQPVNPGPQPGNFQLGNPQSGNPQPGNPQPGNLLNSALGVLPPLGRPRFISGHTPPPGFEQQAPNQANGPPPEAPQP